MDEKQPAGNEEWKKNARTAIYAMAGFYLLTLAYSMFKAIPSSHGNEQLIMIIFTIVFIITGLAMIGYSLTAGYRNIKKSQEKTKDKTNTDSKDTRE